MVDLLDNLSWPQVKVLVNDFKKLFFRVLGCTITKHSDGYWFSNPNGIGYLSTKNNRIWNHINIKLNPTFFPINTHFSSSFFKENQGDIFKLKLISFSKILPRIIGPRTWTSTRLHRPALTSDLATHLAA